MHAPHLCAYFGVRLALSAVGLAGLEHSPDLSPARGRASYASDEAEETAGLLGEDEPTPGFECIDRIMLRVRKRVEIMPRRQKLALGLALGAGLWLLLSTATTLLGRRACTRHMPLVYSHRGFDAAEALYDVTTRRSLADLLDEGLRAFDLDLFWTLDDPEGNMFVGHPPSLRQLWQLEADLVRTPLRELQERKDVKLLPLPDLLRLLSRRQRALTQVSLELKNPEHPQWPRQLALLYEQIAASGIAHKLALVVDDASQAARHRAEQRSHNVRVELLQLHRDLGAPKGPDGAPHFNRTLAREARAIFDGWSVSVKLLEPSLVAASREEARPVSVWVVDDEEALERSYRLGVHGLVTNRPKWAFSQVRAWHAEACARDGRAVAE